MASLFVPRLLTNLTLCGVVLGFVVAAVLALFTLERVVGRFVAHRWGWGGVLVTGWIGVPLHEVSHLISAKLFGHRIVDFRLFSPDPSTGTLGYVRHGPTRPTFYQRAGNFFIGVAPLLGGVLGLGAIMIWTLGADPFVAWLQRTAEAPVFPWQHLSGWETLFRHVGARSLVLADLVWQARTPWLPLQLYLGIAVASHMAPSGRDLIGAARGGFLVLILAVFAIACATATGLRLTGALGLVAPLGAFVVLATAFQTLFATIVAVACPLRK